MIDGSCGESATWILDESGSGTKILWTKTEETGNALYMVSFEDGTWTEPVKISQQGQTLRDADVAALNGKLVGVCNANTQQSFTDLMFFVVSDFTDLAVVILL